MLTYLKSCRKRSLLIRRKPKERLKKPKLSRKARKAEAASRRNEKLARRNPDRLQKQLDELKAITTSGGTLTSHEKTVLEGLERDLKAVKKARETLGDAAPKFGHGHRDSGDRGGFSGRGGRGGGVLGKRRRDESESDEEDVPEDVKNIPMPRDTPPPIPKEILDKWYSKRRERMARERGTNANSTPLGENERKIGQDNPKPVPIVEAKTVYEAKPIVRDLRKEAVAFVPAAVRAKIDKLKGVGGLVEPEEADILERAGYMGKRVEEKHSDSAGDGNNSLHQSSRAVVMEEVEDEDG
ncbi:hypothetical protein EG329_006708 [Mollisiaceae sp. DMI_Dod_QoI]|nr:hypothetical protein EG329_006708 [Helotiales sp. DMI_Dod_QoI]